MFAAVAANKVNKTSMVNAGIRIANQSSAGGASERAEELSGLLATFVLLKPEAFVTSNFPNYHMEDIGELAKSPFENVDIPDKMDQNREETMYLPLVDAFNAYLDAATTHNQDASSSPLRCFNVSQIRSSTDKPNTEFSPDLFLTTEYTEKERTDRKLGRSYLYSPGVVIEVKKDPYDDLGFRRYKEKMVTASEKKKKLLLQMHQYISSQWRLLPYRFLFSITITGHIMRLWKWSPTGCHVTDEIHYKTNPAVLIHFLRALGSSNPNLGLDVGPGMLFEEVMLETLFSSTELAKTSEKDETLDETPHPLVNTTRLTRQCKPKPAYQEPAYLAAESKELEKRINWIRDIYLKRSNNEELGKAKTCTLWLFKLAKSTEELVVFSRPIFKSEGMCTRSTRCYLGLASSDFSSNDIYKWGDNKLLEKLRTVKTSWQDESRTHEGVFYDLVDKRRMSHQESSSDVEKPRVNSIPLAKVLASGDIPGSKQNDGGLKGPGVIVKSKGEEATHTRVLHWLVFEQVGYSLTSFPSTSCLLQALLSALNAHEACFKEGIIHRDISPNNILLDINDSRGFLIDLDMAKDLEDKEHVDRPSRTGTLWFMSTILGTDMMIHRPWYDLESFFWILVFIIFRHVDGITYNRITLLDYKNRKLALDSVFDQRGNTEQEILHYLTLSKRGFLNNGSTVKIPQDAGLLHAFSNMKHCFSSIYQAFSAIEIMDECCKSAARALDPGFTPNSEPRRLDCSCEEDILKIIFSVRENGEQASKDLQIRNPPVRNQAGLLRDLKLADLSLQNAVVMLNFPTYELVRVILEAAIPMASTTSAAIPYTPPEDPRPMDIIGENATIASAAMGKNSEAPVTSFPRRRSRTKRKPESQDESSLSEESDMETKILKKRKTQSNSHHRSFTQVNLRNSS